MYTDIANMHGRDGQESSSGTQQCMISVGDRIVSEGHFGTVKFIGEVPPTEGQWLGVEWDTPDRGKHDGCHKGVRYFECSTPKGGSFVRPKKADTGIEFLQALAYRYIPDDWETADVDSSMAVSCKTVEMVGAHTIAKTQSSFENLKSVTLHDMNISSAGADSVAAKVPNLRELNLSKNLLPSWQELARVTTGMNFMKILNISENRLSLPDNPSSVAAAFQHLQELFINRCNLTWTQVLTSAPMWPNLKKLHACFNKITQLERPSKDTFQCLELLNVEGNQINSWEEVLHLGHLQRLEVLILNGNGLSSVQFGDASFEEKTKHFTALKSLSLSSNNLDSWQSVNELNKLQRLEELNLKRNPLVENKKPSAVRDLFIAKLESLVHCNHSAVSEGERKGAELDYLKKFAQEWIENGGGKNQPASNLKQSFVANHPRYSRLVQVHGAPEITDDAKAKPGALKSSLLELTLTCPQSENKKIKKKLPVTMDVRKVKGLIQKLFKVDVAEQKLFYISQKLPDQEIELDNDLRQLGFFGIESGDTIVVKW